MKLSILTTITDPEERQDKWNEAFRCYMDLADELVIVNGGKPVTQELKDHLNSKVKIIEIPWPYEWNWIELPYHLNAGLKECTGDWIIKLDIDQLIHERHFDEISKKLLEAPLDYNTATMQKMSFTYGKKYYQKGAQPIAFRNKEYLKFGKSIDRGTDLCYVVDTRGIKGFETIDNKILYLGREPKAYKTGVKFYNYDYFFKTKEFTKKEFWRFSRAYNRYFKSWEFGDSEERAFEVFLNMMKGRYNRSTYEYKLEDHSQYIREAVKNLTIEQCGYNLWNLG